MSEPAKNPFDALLDAFRAIVREEIAALDSTPKELLTPEELAEKLKVPLSWVYERSRQNGIPTHRVGRYIRFDLKEVLRSPALKNRDEESACHPLCTMTSMQHDYHGQDIQADAHI